MISEVDIKDYSEDFSEYLSKYQPKGEPENLFNLKRGSVFQINEEGYEPNFFKLETLDGAYSRCWGLSGTPKGQLYHFAAWTPVMEYVKG